MNHRDLLGSLMGLGIVREKVGDILVGHIYGRGQYAALQRRLPGSLIVGVDFDASLREGTVQSRIQMLLDSALS